MPKSDHVPSIAGMLSRKQPDVAIRPATELSTAGPVMGTVQLNARIPRDLNAQLIGIQAKLAERMMRKPKLQDLVAQCLRLGLADVEILADALAQDVGN
jgi:hypothetical protein